ncbi:MAG: hypothetical protein ACRDST_10015 [Pseudonocardiaceae bacterium]
MFDIVLEDDQLDDVPWPDIALEPEDTGQLPMSRCAARRAAAAVVAIDNEPEHAPREAS